MISSIEEPTWVTKKDLNFLTTSGVCLGLKMMVGRSSFWNRQKQLSEILGSIAGAVVHRGRLILWDGNLDRKVLVRSVRKSLLSALIGIEINRGRISLDRTLAELEIDDVPPRLTDDEKKATVEDLLVSRSGVYHDALAESETMTKEKPARGAHPPESHWYYNNWDFNALGTIYERAAAYVTLIARRRAHASVAGSHRLHEM